MKKIWASLVGLYAFFAINLHSMADVIGPDYRGPMPHDPSRRRDIGIIEEVRPNIPALIGIGLTILAIIIVIVLIIKKIKKDKKKDE